MQRIASEQRPNPPFATLYRLVAVQYVAYGQRPSLNLYICEIHDMRLLFQILNDNYSNMSYSGVMTRRTGFVKEIKGFSG